MSEEATSGGSMMDKLGSGERLIAIGAALVAADYILFEVILREYFVSSIMTVLGIVIVAAVWMKHNKPDTEWGVPYGWLLRTLALVTALGGLLELIDDIRFDRLDEAGDVIAGLILYGGAVLMFLGARQMKEDG